MAGKKIATRSKSKKKGLPKERHWADDAVRRMLALFIAFLPIIYNPFGFNLYAPIRAWFLYTSVLLVTFFWLGSCLIKGEINWRHSSLEKPLVFFLLALIVTTALSIHPYSSVFGHFLRYEGLLAWISYLWLFLLSFQLFSAKKDIEKTIKYLAVSAAAISSYAIMQHLGWDFAKWQEGLVTDRVFSTLGNPAYLGAYIALLLPFFFNLSLFKDQPTGRRALLIFASLLLSLALVFTLTRGAWLAIAFALALKLVLNRQAALNALKKNVYAIIIVVVAGVLVFSLAPKSYTAGYVARITSLTKVEGSVGGRILIWKQVIPLIAERPVFGSGLDTLYLTFSTKITPEYERRVVRDTATDRAHNEFLQSAATTGLIGLIGYIALLGGFFILSYQAIQKAQGFWRYALEGIFLSAVSYLFMLQTHFSTIDVSPIFWVLLGVGLSITSKVLKKEEAATIKINSANLNRFVLAPLTVLMIFLSWLSFRPVLADQNYKQAKVMEKSSQPDLALDYYRRAISYDVFNDFYWNEMSGAYISAAPTVKNALYLSKGIEAAKRAVALSPRNEYNYLKLGDAYLAGYEYSGKRDKLAKAILAFEKGRKIDPNYAEMRLKLGIAYAYARANRSAIKEWQKVVSLSPKSASAFYNLGKVYEQRGETDRAAYYYQKAAALDPSQKQTAEAIKNLGK